MPRIKADSIAEHVERQRASVLDAAVRLFVERGYGDDGLADIAAEVGLARNSLYRYVPDKTHLLVDWYRQTVPQTVSAWEEVTAGDDPAPVRLARWARTYLAWVATPEHQLVGPLTEALSGLDDVTRAEVAALHRQMMGVVASVVADAGVPAADVDAVVDLLAGLVLGAARSQMTGDGLSAAVGRRLDAAIAALVATGGPA